MFLDYIKQASGTENTIYSVNFFLRYYSIQIFVVTATEEISK